MSRRRQIPDTGTDMILRVLLDNRQSFIMTAGAGSGKTTSLVKALSYINVTYGAKLRSNRQKIACITYTLGAEREILRDVNEDPLFHVSTIHSFLWCISKPFQNDIRKWVEQKIQDKISDLQKIRDGFSPRVQQKTRDKNIADSEKYKYLATIITSIRNFNYGVSANYAEGMLGHDDILNLGPELILKYPLMQKLIAQQYPFILIDESQDTFPNVITAFKEIQKASPQNICLGFFGDPMQQIYLTGIGKIDLPEGWSQVEKPENYRCSSKVLSVINKIRVSGDPLQQTPHPEAPLGSARLFLMAADENRDQKIEKVRNWISKKDGDSLWLAESPGELFRTLVLVHRMAAKRLKFRSIYEALNDNAPESFKNGFLDGSLWALKPFLNFALPVVEAQRNGNQGKVISLLREFSPALSEERFKTAAKPSEELSLVKVAIENLVFLLSGSNRALIRDIYKLMHDCRLYDLDQRILRSFDILERDLDDETSEDVAAFVRFCQCMGDELWGYQKYLIEESAFSTQHGVKGDEFERVLVVLDDEEAKYNLYSYERYLGLQSLSETDLKRKAEGKETTIDRTRRLFYVCCSRAKKHLAVVVFVTDPDRALEILKKENLFETDQIFMESALN